jgi:mannose-6-phosphate isomerase-like protein (cupin superfamily)
VGVLLTPIVIKDTIALTDLRGRRLAVDANGELYQFLALIRLPDGTPLQDNGRITSHLVGLFYRTTRLIADHGLKLVYVFDGAPPARKAQEIAKRREIRRRFEEERSATYVKAGQGLPIERRGTRAGHQYQLLGHSFSRLLAVEPYLITLSKDSDVFPIFQHEGVEFLFMLEGEVGYRHGDKTYLLQPGDSLYFDADVPHGPEELRKLPARYISVICYARGAE